MRLKRKKRVHPAGTTADDEDEKPVSFFRLYSYTNRCERVLLVIGVIACLGAGAMVPLLERLLGEKGNLLAAIIKFNNGKCNGTGAENPTEEEVYQELEDFAFEILYIGAAHCCFNYIYIMLFSYVAECQAHRLKSLYLRAILRQDMAFRDLHFGQQDHYFVGTFFEDISKVQEATGEKVGLLLYIVFTSLLSGLNAFSAGGVYLALVVSSVTPFMIGVSVFMYYKQAQQAVEEEHLNDRADALSNETLSNIKVVHAFNGEKSEVRRYKQILVDGKKLVKKRVFVEALGTGILWFLNFSTFAIAFWIGADLILSRDPCTFFESGYNVEQLMSCFKVVNGTFEICQYFPYIDIIAEGRGAAAFIFSICERKAPIDSCSTAGLLPTEPLRGVIELKNVRFSYPNRHDVTVIKNLSLVIQPGVYCIVGPRGSGKSTLVQLLLRFYDPDEGQILYDGLDAREYNLGWLRSQVAVISQETFLFNTTIVENIRYGKPDATMEEIEEACKVACAHGFIMALPDKYDTLIGRGGHELSAYEKQRIAIARALVRNSPILIFDEATTALETKNQSRWHRGIIKYREGKTTIIVAHLLPTLNMADCIISLKDGQLDEMGTNDELLESGGTYSKLYQKLEHPGELNVVRTQTIRKFKKVVTLTKFLRAANFHTRVADSITSLAHRHDLLDLDDDPKHHHRHRHRYHHQFENDSLAKSPFLQLVRLSGKVWHLVVMGFLMALALGLTCPTYATLFGRVLQVINYVDVARAKQEVYEYSLTIVLIGFTAGFTTAVQTYCMAWATDGVLSTLRGKIFISLLKQDLAWFDSLQMLPKTLYSMVSSEIVIISLALGTRLSNIVQAVATLAMTIGISFYMNPTLGLCTLIIPPIVLGAAAVSIIVIQKQVLLEKDATEDASEDVYLAYSQLKTVAILHREDDILAYFTETLQGPHRGAKRLAHYLGILHGVSHSTLYLAYAAVVYFATDLLREDKLDYSDLFTIGEALTWCMLVLGQAVAYCTNLSRARVAASRIFSVVNRKPKLVSGEKIPPADLRECDIELKNVEFSFPDRPEFKALRGLDLYIHGFEHVGLVGSTDCGKFALIPLLLRLYDPDKGYVKIGGVNIKEWKLRKLRAQMSVVFAEPMLFNRTIAENIAYGDNSRVIPIADVVQAAKTAAIHDFIDSLPQGYHTVVGASGSHLSEGQQHAIAFARAILKKPSMLLLEQVLQEFDLDSIKMVENYLHHETDDMTVVFVSSALKPIMNCDRIVVLHLGKEGESGTHLELVEANGVYSKLWELQHLGFHLD